MQQYIHEYLTCHGCHYNSWLLRGAQSSLARDTSQMDPHVSFCTPCPTPGPSTEVFHPPPWMRPGLESKTLPECQVLARRRTRRFRRFAVLSCEIHTQAQAQDSLQNRRVEQMGTQVTQAVCSQSSFWRGHGSESHGARCLGCAPRCSPWSRSRSQRPRPRACRPRSGPRPGSPRSCRRRPRVSVGSGRPQVSAPPEGQPNPQLAEPRLREAESASHSGLRGRSPPWTLGHVASRS